MAANNEKNDLNKGDDLIWAVITRNLDSIQHILKQEPIAINQKNMHGNLALNQAIRAGYDEVVELLLAKSLWNLDVNAKDNRGFAPIHEAALQNNVKLIKALIERGADVNSGKTEKNGTPLHFAIYSEHYEVADCLLDHGADVNATCDNFIDSKIEYHELTPLHLAAIRGDIPCIALLSYFGADREQKVKEGLTPVELLSKFHTNASFSRDQNSSLISADEAFDEAYNMGRMDRSNDKKKVVIDWLPAAPKKAGGENVSPSILASVSTENSLRQFLDPESSDSARKLKAS